MTQSLEMVDAQRPGILIVDDEMVDWLAVKGVLERRCQVCLLLTRSVDEALRMVAEQPCALLLLDEEMLDLDDCTQGISIKTWARTHDLPMLLVTDRPGHDASRLHGYRCGAVDYIEKPLYEEILVAKIGVFVALFLAKKQREQSQAAPGLPVGKREQGLESRLAWLTQELERSNRDLQQFVFAASHDLQAPLRLITGYVQLFEKRYHGTLDEKASLYFGYIIDSARHMQALINGLLDFSRVSTQGQDFAMTDCTEVMHQAIAHLQSTILASGAVITHDPLPNLDGDRAQLVRLFQHLMDNAIKFHDSSVPIIHVSVRKERDEWIFSIQDNGIGIEPKFAERIFIIFQKLHAHGKYPGIGIGLPICRRIVERHGGRIWVEQNNTKGAVFRFIIPDHTIQESG